MRYENQEHNESSNEINGFCFCPENKHVYHFLVKIVQD